MMNALYCLSKFRVAQIAFDHNRRLSVEAEIHLPVRLGFELYGLAHAILENFNTPEDLARAKAILDMEEG